MSLTRATTNLTARTESALQRLTDATGDSRTDVINHAVRLYDLLREPLEAGQVFIEGADGRERIHVL